MSVSITVEVQNDHQLIVYARKNSKLRIIPDVNAIEWSNYKRGSIKLSDVNIPEEDKKWLQND